MYNHVYKCTMLKLKEKIKIIIAIYTTITALGILQT